MVAGGNDGGTITDTKFFSNSAALDGGALYLRNRAIGYTISGDEALESLQSSGEILPVMSAVQFILMMKVLLLLIILYLIQIQQ